MFGRGCRGRKITLSFPAGETIEYKYTRGSWPKVEKGTEGEEIPNRLLTVPGGNHIQNDIVANWADIPASVFILSRLPSGIPCQP